MEAMAVEMAVGMVAVAAVAAMVVAATAAVVVEECTEVAGRMVALAAATRVEDPGEGPAAAAAVRRDRCTCSCTAVAEGAVQDPSTPPPNLPAEYMCDRRAHSQGQAQGRSELSIHHCISVQVASLPVCRAEGGTLGVEEGWVEAAKGAAQQAEETQAKEEVAAKEAA